jgi:hypothetical protein
MEPYMLNLTHLLNRAILALPVVKRAQELTRAEFDAALQSVAHELDIEIALTRRLGNEIGWGFAQLCAGRVAIADEMRLQDERAEFDALVSRMTHPSNGGES